MLGGYLASGALQLESRRRSSCVIRRSIFAALASCNVCAVAKTTGEVFGVNLGGIVIIIALINVIKVFASRRVKQSAAAAKVAASKQASKTERAPL